MDIEILRLKISEEKDLEALRRMAMLLTECVPNGTSGPEYDVIDDASTEHVMYTGTREECVAFVEGYETAPQTDVGCLDPSELCICVDRTIVIPERRFGEQL